MAQGFLQLLVPIVSPCTTLACAPSLHVSSQPRHATQPKTCAWSSAPVAAGNVPSMTLRVLI
uniref:Uncharacterized protein n=1 Tax=Setaria italica TaxID=4555 RepID=K3Y0R7_SETIT